MKKKYFIHDEDGQRYEVEEISEEKEVEPVEETHDEDETNALSVDEISALKRLAAVADKLIEMTSAKDVDDEDGDEIEKEHIDKEEVIDTDEDLDEDCSTRDSKSSFNSIEQKRSKQIDDSIDPDEDINSAWAKRYNGGK